MLLLVLVVVVEGLGRSAFRGHVWVAGGSADHGLFVFSVGVCGFESWGFRI